MEIKSKKIVMGYTDKEQEALELFCKVFPNSAVYCRDFRCEECPYYNGEANICVIQEVCDIYRENLS